MGGKVEEVLSKERTFLSTWVGRVLASDRDLGPDNRAHVLRSGLLTSRTPSVSNPVKSLLFVRSGGAQHLNEAEVEEGETGVEETGRVKTQKPGS